mgnify:CR=1 FL=1
MLVRTTVGLIDEGNRTAWDSAIRTADSRTQPPRNELRLTLFGPPTATGDGRQLRFRRRSAIALLAYLVVTGRTSTRARLAALLTDDPDYGPALLRNTVSGIIVCMSRYPKLKLAEHLTSRQLQQHYRDSAAVATARRWQALWQFSLGHQLGAVASLVGLHRNTVRKLIARYNAHGPEAVVDGRTHNPGTRQPYLNVAQEQELRALLAQPHPDGGLWTSARVARWIATATGRAHIHPQFGWFTMRRLGYTPQVPRPRHRQAATPDAQQDWKKS